MDTPQFCHEFILNCLRNYQSPQPLPHPTPLHPIPTTHTHTHTHTHTMLLVLKRKKKISPHYRYDFRNHGQNSPKHSPTNSILWEYILIDLFQVRSLSVGTSSVVFYFYHCQRWYITPLYFITACFILKNSTFIFLLEEVCMFLIRKVSKA